MIFILGVSILITSLVLVNRLHDFVDENKVLHDKVTLLEYRPECSATCHVCDGKRYVEGTQVSWTEGFWKLMEACKAAGYTNVSIQERLAGYDSIPETNETLLKYFPKFAEVETRFERGYFIACSPTLGTDPAIWKIVEDLKLTNNFSYTEQARGYDYATVHHYNNFPTGRWTLKQDGKWVFREF